MPNNLLMLNEISHITWTKDSKSEHGVFVKSDADDISLISILKRYNINSKYTVHSLENEDINKELKKQKRKEFIRKNPYANTENPFMEVV